MRPRRQSWAHSKTRMNELILQNEPLNRLETHKKDAQNATLANRYRAFDCKKFAKIHQCGNFLAFESFENIETLEIIRRVRKANFCKNRFCLVCAWRASRKFFASMKSIIKQAQQRHDLAFLFLTLTIRNCPMSELRGTIMELSEAFDSLRRKREFKNSILGFMRSLEFLGDNTLEGQAHPHYHIILAVDKKEYFAKNFISQTRWLELWKQALNVDYKPIVDIRRIKAKNEQWSDVDSALFETLKYCIAPQVLERLSQQDFLELDKQVKHIQQFNKGGIFRTIKPKIDELDSELWRFIGYEFFEWCKDRYSFLGLVNPDSSSEKEIELLKFLDIATPLKPLEFLK